MLRTLTWDYLTDARAADLLTVITSTSAFPDMPSVRYLRAAQNSLCQVPVLARCKKLIVFDGLSPKFTQQKSDYDNYKYQVSALVREDPAFQNTTLVFCKDWMHLAGALRTALKLAHTPVIFLHQHDDILIKPFDIKGCITSMFKNPHLKHIHLTRYINALGHSGDMQTSWDGPVDDHVEGGNDVPLTRCFGWSDYSHLTTVNYMRDFVLPKCGHGFMETFLQHLFKRSLKGKVGAEIDEVHRQFGTYLYGNLEDGPYIYHLDGNKARNGSSRLAGSPAAEVRQELKTFAPVSGRASKRRTK